VEGGGGDVVAHSQCVRAKSLSVCVPVLLGDGLGSVFAFMTVHMGVVVAVGVHGGGLCRRLSPSWPLRMDPINKTTVLNVVREVLQC